MTEAIRRRPLITFLVICILVNIGIVALPCETFGADFEMNRRDVRPVDSSSTGRKPASLNPKKTRTSPCTNGPRLTAGKTAAARA
jgi:hypothetical protein